MTGNIQRLPAALLLASLLAGKESRADVPAQINFQGRIELPAAEIEASGNAADNSGKDKSNPIPFTGNGKFKFAIVSSTGAVFWTNAPNAFVVPPPNSVSIPVQDGIFNAALGDPALGMPPITPQVFASPDRLLRVFFQGEIESDHKKKLTPERELLPPQKLLTVPFAFQSGSAQTALDQKTIVTLLSGATIQGSFEIANALSVSPTVVQSFATLKVGHSWDIDTNFNPSGMWSASGGPGSIATTPKPGPAFNFPSDISGGAKLNVEAAGGLFLNQLATGPVSITAGGGSLSIGTTSQALVDQTGNDAAIAPDGMPVVMRVAHNAVGLDTPWDVLFADESDPSSYFAMQNGGGQVFMGHIFRPDGAREFIFMNPFTIQLAVQNLFSHQSTNLTLVGGSGPGRGVSIDGNLRVSGTKSFVQDDPASPQKEIVFYSLEGPEAGTYARGTARLAQGEAVVNLPSEFAKVTSNTGAMTAQLTPLDECKGLRVVNRSPSQLIVRELAGGKSSASFDWLVQGVRAGYEGAPTWQDKKAPEPDPVPAKFSGVRKRKK